MIKKIFITIFLILSFALIPSFVFASPPTTPNINSDSPNQGKSKDEGTLDKMNDNGNFLGIGSNTGEKGIQSLLLVTARDLKNVVFLFVTIIGLVLVIKLIFASNTDEEQKKLKKGIIWCSIGIIVMQSSFSVYKVLFNKEDVNVDLATDFYEDIIKPFINLLKFLASFIFVAMGIYAFYIIVLGSGEEEKTKKGKMIIIQAILGFVVIKFADFIVDKTFKVDSGGMGNTNISSDITENAQIVIKIINWLNGFVAIAVVLMLIYAGFLVMTGGGEPEKNKKAKNIMLFAAIGVLILFASYTIMVFFILPNSPIS